MTLVALSSADYDEDQLEHKKARTFGCSVSYNAYTDSPFTAPKPPKSMRSMGFHIHVGFNQFDESGNEVTNEDILRLIKTMDLFVGVPSILIDKDTRRRQLYGKAGEHRVKYNYNPSTDAYTVIPEYRVLGGNILMDNNLIIWAYKQTVAAIEAFNKNIDLPGDIVEQCINGHMEGTAQDLCEQYEIKVPIIEIYPNHNKTTQSNKITA